MSRFEMSVTKSPDASHRCHQKNNVLLRRGLLITRILFAIGIRLVNRRELNVCVAPLLRLECASQGSELCQVIGEQIVVGVGNPLYYKPL